MKRHYLPILLALFYATLLPAASLTTLQLQHRPATEIIPIIEPLLEPGNKISGEGYRIFLRASPQTVDEVRELIEAIDVGAKSVIVSVFHGRRSDLEKRNISGHIRIDNGDISGSIAAGETRRSESGGPVHRLRIVDGSEGFIATGTRSALYSANEANAASGFYVLPRINGDRVTLQISPFSNQLKASGGGIQTLQAATTISGRLGEWLPLGGVDERIERRQSDGIGKRSMNSSQHDSIWIRADLER